MSNSARSSGERARDSRGRIAIQLWLHREQGDAWLVSANGVGAGVYVPKAALDWPGDMRPAAMGASGPWDALIDAGIAETKGLVSLPDPNQTEMF